MPEEANFDFDAAERKIRAAKTQKRRDDLDFLLHEYLEKNIPTLTRTQIESLNPELNKVKDGMTEANNFIARFKIEQETIEHILFPSLKTESEQDEAMENFHFLGTEIAMCQNEISSLSERGRIIIKGILSNKEKFDLLDQMVPPENDPIITTQITAELKKCSGYALPKAKQKLEALLEKINTEFEKCINERERTLLEKISIVIAAILTLPVFAALAAVSHYKTGSPAFWKGKEEITPITREGANTPSKPNKSQ